MKSLGKSLSAWRTGLWTLLLACSLLAGCATSPNTPASGAANPATSIDPWESWNRKVWAFNDTVDAAVLKPVAETYRKVVPELVRTGVSNVFGNLGDLWSAANHLLQGKLQHSLEMGMRFATNTMFGLGGVLDPATDLGLVRRPEDFGQTLGRWGVGTGPYLVLPLLGPSTLRDTGALLVDRQAAATNFIINNNHALAVTALEVVHGRAGLLSATQLLDSVALDRYSFVRQGFLARRLDAVLDGKGAAAADDMDPGDSPPPPSKQAPK